MSVTGAGWRKESTAFPVVASHTRTAFSKSAAGRRLASGLKQSPSTFNDCPSQVKTSLPVREFHSLTRSPLPPAASHLPSGLKQTWYSSPLFLVESSPRYPLIVRGLGLAVTFHTCTVPSGRAENNRCPSGLRQNPCQIPPNACSGVLNRRICCPVLESHSLIT